MAKVVNGCFELIANGNIDQKVATGVENEEQMVERDETVVPNRRRKIWKYRMRLGRRVQSRKILNNLCTLMFEPSAF